MKNNKNLSSLCCKEVKVAVQCYIKNTTLLALISKKLKNGLKVTTTLDLLNKKPSKQINSMTKERL